MGLNSKSLWNYFTNEANVAPVGTQRIPVAVQPGTAYVSQINHVLMSALPAFVATGLNVQGSTYLPVASVLVNLDAAVPAAGARFLRIGAVVFVSGLIDLDPTAAGVASLRMTVPIASAFAAVANASGTFSDAILDNGRISAVAATALVILEFTAISVASTTYGYNFSYTII